MTRPRQFAYVQVRLQAQHSRFPDQAAWRRLEAITSLGHLLNTLRNGPMRPWAMPLDTQMDAHQLESALRTLYRDHVTAVSRWHPPAWRSAVRWVAALIDLPALEHLLTQPTIPRWVRHDPRLKHLAIDHPAVRLQVLEESDYGAVISGWRKGLTLTDAWRRHWRTLWPPLVPKARRPLYWLEAQLASQREVLGSEQAPDSGGARRQLAEALVSAFRRHTHEPVEGFIHLAFTALQLERLRATVLRLLLEEHRAA